jgi:PPOX class probable F420-dependent enzyme
VSRRDLIKMSGEEVLDFLQSQRVLTCGTVGKDGWPHLMPLWYVVRDGRIWAWTYAKSQKARNLERTPIATLQVEAGTEYHELRGVMFKTDVVLHRESAVVERFVDELVDRYAGGADEAREAFRRQVPKRVVMEFAERSRATWDHRKLAGVY